MDLALQVLNPKSGKIPSELKYSFGASYAQGVYIALSLCLCSDLTAASSGCFPALGGEQKEQRMLAAVFLSRGLQVPTGLCDSYNAITPTTKVMFLSKLS